MSKEYKLRHFIICDEIVNRDDNTFDCNGIFEFITSPTYPSDVQFAAVIGIQSLQHDYDFKFRVVASQVGIDLFNWTFECVQIHNPHEIMNFLMMPDEEGCYIMQEGIVEFKIYIDDKLFDTQFIHAIKG